jgi:hypothetical protein
LKITSQHLCFLTFLLSFCVLFSLFQYLEIRHFEYFDSFSLEKSENMGRLHQAGRPASSSHSLHSFDDAPPPYTDNTEPIIAPDQYVRPIQPAQPPTNIRPLRLIDSAYVLPGSENAKPRDKVSLTLDPALSSDCDRLYNVISRQMKLPPRPLLYIHGTHTEVRKGEKKDEYYTVTDFCFALDLAETMLTGWEGDHMGANWRKVQILTDEDVTPAYRGGILRSSTYTLPKSRAAISLSGDTEAILARNNADEQNNTSSLDAKNLMMWCERFCRDPAPVKSYALPPRVRYTLLISMESTQVHYAPRSPRLQLQRYA